jgi:hypothetical protein
LDIEYALKIEPNPNKDASSAAEYALKDEYAHQDEYALEREYALGSEYAMMSLYLEACKMKVPRQ